MLRARRYRMAPSDVTTDTTFLAKRFSEVLAVNCRTERSDDLWARRSKGGRIVASSTETLGGTKLAHALYSAYNLNRPRHALALTPLFIYYYVNDVWGMSAKS